MIKVCNVKLVYTGACQEKNKGDGCKISFLLPKLRMVALERSNVRITKTEVKETLKIFQKISRFFLDFG